MGWKEYFNPCSRENPTRCLELIKRLNAAGFYRFQPHHFLKLYKTECATSQWELYDTVAGEQTECYVRNTCAFYKSKILAQKFDVHRKHYVINAILEFTGIETMHTSLTEL